MRHQKQAPAAVETKVPRISWDGDKAFSNSLTPVNQPDTAACWAPAAMRSAKFHLLSGKTVICLDATAYAAMLSLSIHIMMTEGHTITAKVEKAF